MSRRVSLLAMGGTISTDATPDGFLPAYGAEHLASQVSGLSDRVTISARDVMKISGRAVTPSDMWDLAGAVAEEIRNGAEGVVVTHGTDTMEESAYALALLLDCPVPVVLTGAMRPAHLPGADGEANLVSALIAASHPALAPFGPVVAFQDEVHAARWVTKQHSARVAAYASPAAGPIATVVEGRVQILHGPDPHNERLESVAPPDRRVELIWATAGADGLLVDAIATEVDGLIIAGTGGGHVAPPLADSLVRLAQSGCPIILASRCGASSQVLQETYGGVGSERHLLSEGILSAGSLSPLKSRLRLIFGLSAGLRAPELFK